MTTLKFKTDSNELQRQIKLAKKVGGNNELVPVVTNTKLTVKSKKSHYGFCFKKKGSVQVGDIFTNDDNSISKAEAII